MCGGNPGRLDTGLPKVVVCEYELWVLWVLGSGCWVRVLLALVLKLDGRKTHDLRMTGLESTTHHHVDGCKLRLWDAREMLKLGNDDRMSRTGGCATTISVNMTKQPLRVSKSL